MTCSRYITGISLNIRQVFPVFVTLLVIRYNCVSHGDESLAKSNGLVEQVLNHNAVTSHMEMTVVMFRRDPLFRSYSRQEFWLTATPGMSGGVIVSEPHSQGAQEWLASHNLSDDWSQSETENQACYWNINGLFSLNETQNSFTEMKQSQVDNIRLAEALMLLIPFAEFNKEYQIIGTSMQGGQLKWSFKPRTENVSKVAFQQATVWVNYKSREVEDVLVKAADGASLRYHVLTADRHFHNPLTGASQTPPDRFPKSE